MANSEEVSVDVVAADNLQQRQSLDSVLQASNSDRELSTPVVPGKPYEDGYNWRKYGQKNVRANEYIRSYFKCSYHSCLVKKQVERSHDGRITDTVYFGKHDHPKPQSSPQSAVRSLLSVQVELPGYHPPIALADKPSGVRTPKIEDIELKDAHETSSAMDPPAGGTVVDGDTNENLTPKRRKKSIGNVYPLVDKPTSESRVVVETVSAVDVVDDGYRWRKYGQKMVKGNRNPRSYYRCSNGGCPAKKHVERASHDPKVVIATYEGQHDHEMSLKRAIVPHTITMAAASQNGTTQSKSEETDVAERASLSKPENISPKAEAKDEDPPPPPPAVNNMGKDSSSGPGSASNKQQSSNAICEVSPPETKPKDEQVPDAIVSSSCPEIKSNNLLPNVKAEPVGC
ncbi:hypothetical protein Dimus_009756 [Dionaea muscipula]